MVGWSGISLIHLPVAREKSAHVQMMLASLPSSGVLGMSSPPLVGLWTPVRASEDAGVSDSGAGASPGTLATSSMLSVTAVDVIVGCGNRLL